MKLNVLSAVLAAAIAIPASAALAGGNSPAAQNMVEDLKANRGSASIARELRPGGALAQTPGNQGWGNAGSAVVSEDQVSDYGRTK